MTADDRAAGLARRFLLVRLEDVSGVSGTGVVADGVAFPDGAAVLHWRGPMTSTAVYASAAMLEAIHGHDGRTQVRWVD